MADDDTSPTVEIHIETPINDLLDAPRQLMLDEATKDNDVEEVVSFVEDSIEGNLEEGGAPDAESPVVQLARQSVQVVYENPDALDQLQ